MKLKDNTKNLSTSRTTLLFVALLLIGLNLRVALTSLPPLVGDIEQATGLSSVWSGLLTTLPVLAMGIFAPVAPRLVHRFGTETTILLSLGLLTVGIGGRFWGDTISALYISTTLAGCGIAITGAVLPSLVREHFASRGGMITGFYTAAMALGATIASGAAIPLRDILGSWEESLAFWALPALIAFLVWIPIFYKAKRIDHSKQIPRIILPWRNPHAWIVTGYVTVQSLLFFSQMAWLAPSYVSYGHTDREAGLLFAAYSVAGLIATILIPTLSDRLKDKRPLILGAVGCALIGLIMLTFLPTFAPWVTVIVLGFGQTASFALGLVLLVACAAEPRAAGQLTAMAFLVAYIVAAIGPTLLGALHDITGGYFVPFLVLSAINIIPFILAFFLKPDLRINSVD